MEISLTLLPNQSENKEPRPEGFGYKLLCDMIIFVNGLIYVLDVQQDQDNDICLVHEGKPVALVCLEEDAVEIIRVYANDFVDCTISLKVILEEMGDFECS